MSDTRMVNKIAWWLHPECWDDAESEEGVKMKNPLDRVVQP